MGLLDAISPTPRNRILGLLADATHGVNDFASKPFGYDNPPARMLMGLLDVPSIATTLDRLSYGEPLTNIGKANVPPTIFTTVSDMFPRRSVSSVVGIGGMAGSVAGILFPLLIGYLLDAYKATDSLSHGYHLIFSWCSSAYLLAWIIIHFLVPRMEKVSID